MASRYGADDYVKQAHKLFHLRPVSILALVPGWTRQVQAVADMFARDRPHFNKALFMEACGVEEITISDVESGHD